jgi:hypothetical protein
MPSTKKTPPKAVSPMPISGAAGARVSDGRAVSQALRLPRACGGCGARGRRRGERTSSVVEQHGCATRMRRGAAAVGSAQAQP